MTEIERKLDLLLGDALTELERLQRRKWVGLTEEDIQKFAHGSSESHVREINDYLIMKNT
jgi:hypothetical protein